MPGTSLASRIDASVLTAIAPKLPGFKARRQAEIIASFASLLPQLLEQFAVTTAARIVHLLAQLGHESDGFSTTEEYASGAAYEGRSDLGNTRKGDGVRFKGRGPIQLTGRDNYRKFTAWLRAFIPDCPDFEQQPHLVALFPWAAWAVFFFWATKGLNKLADRDDLVAVTKVVNGGRNGLADRAKYLAKAKHLVVVIEGDKIATEQDFIVLRRGHDSDLVDDLQRALAAAGHYLLTIDGNFGPGTEAAVKTFQRSRGLTIDGIVGRNTAQALEPFKSKDWP